MAFVPFYDTFQYLALAETRSITIAEGHPGLPADDYGFFELFCDDPGCDCRRVLFDVVSRREGKTMAVISWGWETYDFYLRWLGRNADLLLAREMQGLDLNRLSEQSDLAPALLRLTSDVLLADPAYVERVKRHYSIFRGTVDEGSPPLKPNAPSSRTKKPHRKP